MSSTNDLLPTAWCAAHLSVGGLQPARLPKGPGQLCLQPDQAPYRALCLLRALLSQRRLFWEQRVSCHLLDQPHWLLLSYPQLQLSCCQLLHPCQGCPLQLRTPQRIQSLS